MAQVKGFVKNIVFEQTKKLVMVLTGFVYVYLIANYLGPADYGLVTYFIAFASIVNMFGVKAFQNLIQIFMPKSKSKNLFWKIIKWQYLIIIPVISAIFVFSEQITFFLGKPGFELLQVSALLMIFMPFYVSIVFFFSSLKMFGKVLKIESIMQIGTLAFSLLFVFGLGLGTFGVVYGQLVAVLLCIALALYYFKKTSVEGNKFDRQEIVKYGKFQFLNSITQNFYNNFFKIVIGLFVGAVGLGYYYLVNKIASSFIGKTTSSIYDVLMPYSMEKCNERKVLARFVSLGLKLNLLITLIIGIFLILVSKPLLEIFMDEYSAAYILIPLYVVLRLISSFDIMGQALMSISKAEYLFFSGIAAFVVGIPASVLIVSELGWTGIIPALIIFNLTKNSALFYFARKEKIFIEIIPTREDFMLVKSKIDIVLSGLKNRQ